MTDTTEATMLPNPAETKIRIYTLIGLALAMFLGALDQTIVATAMPRIVSDLSGLERYTWVTTVYLLASTLLVPVYGKLSDILSRRSLEIFSVALFLTGSALCGLAGEWGRLPLLGDGMNQLIVFRGLQGLGAAGIFALAFIIVSDLYPPRERGKINGVFGAVFGLSSVLGPLAGGFLTDHAGSWLPHVAGWRWVFYVNLPLGALALWFIATRMPRLRPKDDSHKMDYASAALMMSAFLPLILALQLDKAVYPWGGPLVLSLLAASLLLMAAWIWHSLARSEHPILDLRLYKGRVFAFSGVAVFLFGGAFMAIIIFLPVYMVFAQGVSATSAGVSVIPLSLGSVLGSTLSGPLITKIGKYRGTMIAGALLTLVGFGLLNTVGASTSYGLIVLYMFVAGLGFGPLQSVFSLSAQNAVEPAKIGQATSAIQFNRQIGAVMAAAVLGVVFNSALSQALPKHGIDSSRMPEGGTSSLGQGTQEIRAGIIAGFDSLEARLDGLFALRGAEAKAGLEALLADPSLPGELKDRLKDGTPAMRIDGQFGSLYAALRLGDSATAASILDSPGTRDSLPAQAREALIGVAALPSAARAARLPSLVAGLEARKLGMEKEASDAAAAMTRKSLDVAKVAVADSTVSGLKASFSDAVRRVWLYASFLAIALLVAVLMIPNLPLRGRGAAPRSVEGADRGAEGGAEAIPETFGLPELP
jgi:EmrB/QacA subfamily drug resistance transporter